MKLHYSSQLSLFIQHTVHGVTSSLASIGQCMQEAKLVGDSDKEATMVRETTCKQLLTTEIYGIYKCCLGTLNFELKFHIK